MVCIEDAAALDAAAAELDARVQAMATRAELGVSNTARNAATVLLVLQAQFDGVRAAGVHAAESSRVSFADAVEEARANGQQLRATAAAALCATPLSGIACGLDDAFTFYATGLYRTSWVVSLVPVEDYDVLSLHVLATRDADPFRCEFTGTGLKHYVPLDTATARASNVIRMVARDATGAVLQWVTQHDIQLRLSPAFASAGLLLAYELFLDGDAWTVAYSVHGVSPLAAFCLKIVIGSITGWDGNVEVRVVIVYEAQHKYNTHVYRRSGTAFKAHMCSPYLLLLVLTTAWLCHPMARGWPCHVST